MLTSRFPLIAAALLIAASALPSAEAQTLYRVRMPDGSILVTDRVPPNGVVIDSRPAAPRPDKAGDKGAQKDRDTDSARKLREEGRALEQRLRERDAQYDAVNREIADAERALEEAKQRLERGREPQPGEVIGNAGGGARIAPEYEQRIKSLEQAIVAAEERVQKAYAARNALR